MHFDIARAHVCFPTEGQCSYLSHRAVGVSLFSIYIYTPSSNTFLNLSSLHLLLVLFTRSSTQIFTETRCKRNEKQRCQRHKYPPRSICRSCSLHPVHHIHPPPPERESVSTQPCAPQWLMWVIDALRYGMPSAWVEVCWWCRLAFSRPRWLTGDVSLLLLERARRNVDLLNGRRAGERSPEVRSLKALYKEGGETSGRLLCSLVAQTRATCRAFSLFLLF